jgi:penicillin-binding protein 2
MRGRNNKLTQYDLGVFRRKLGTLTWLVFFAFALLTARMWYLQVVKGETLRQRSKNNRIRLHEIKPLRGLILDARGKILVDNQPSFDISIIPEAAKDVKSIIEKLAYVCNESNAKSLRDFSSSKNRRPFVPVKLERNISRDKLAVVETNSLDLPGVVIDIIPVRKYIYGEMMSHILGYVGEISDVEINKDSYGQYRLGDITGKLGVEKQMDRYLKGERGGEQIEVNVNGRQLDVLGRVEPVSGYNVMLTIDAELQKICWEAFQKKAGAVIVMDPRDGSILAMVSKPSFDPNLFKRGISNENWEKLLNNSLCPMQNKAISGQYPPGSTYKPVVAAAALEEGLITPDATFYCNGTYRLGNRTYRCWKKHGHGEISLHRAIVESCDVYFYNVGKLVGVDKLAEYSKGFGFGNSTGVQFPGEKKGLVPTKGWKLDKWKEPWQMGETISLSIGQGFVLLTPLQLIRAYCALANGGILYKPQLIKKIKTEKGQIIKEFFPEVQSFIPVSKGNIEILDNALWGVVNEPHGTGWALKGKERDVCGKTGTAQVIGMPQDKEKPDMKEVPYKYRDHALFVCFAPYKDPEVAVVVIVEHGGHGGSAAAPIARKIIDGYFELQDKRNGFQSGEAKSKNQILHNVATEKFGVEFRGRR